LSPDRFSFAILAGYPARWRCHHPRELVQTSSRIDIRRVCLRWQPEQGTWPGPVFRNDPWAPSAIMPWVCIPTSPSRCGTVTIPGCPR